MAVRPDAVETREHMLGWYPERPIDKLTADQAWDLIRSRVSFGSRGHDPVQLQLERLWFRNIAYFVGLQENALDVPALPDFDLWSSYVIPQYSANHIGRIVSAEVSRLSAARPAGEVSPRSSDQRDLFGARVGSAIAEWNYDRLDLTGKRVSLANWMVNCGAGFMYGDWNKRMGKRQRLFFDPISQEALNAEQMTQEERTFYEALGSFQDVREGDIEGDVIGPFQVRVPLGPTKLEDMPWVCVTHLRSREWLWEHYPNRAAELDVDAQRSSVTLDTFWWRRLATLISQVASPVPSRSTPFWEGIEVHDLWLPAFGRFRRGARVRACEAGLLDFGPNPYFEAGYEDEWHPLTMFGYKEVPGRFWPKSLTEDLIQPQDDYNVGRQQLITQRDVLSKPQWLSPREAKLGPTRNDTGDLWEYDARGTPHPPIRVDPPGLSTAHVQTAGDALRDMQTISAQSEVSQAQVPEGVRSGVAIRALQEKDTMVVRPIIAAMESRWQRYTRHLLQLCSRFMQTPRMVDVYGESRQADVHWFKGIDMSGNTHYRVRPGSMMPRSRAFEQQMFLDAVAAGMLDPMDPEIRRYGMQVLEIGGLDKVFLELDLDRRRAAQEEQMFLMPDPDPSFAFPDVDEHDDHEAHLRSHLIFYKTDAYERLPEARKMAFRAHMAKHQLYIARLIETQAMLAAPPPGGGGGSPPKPPGEASQPRERQPTPGTNTVETA